MFWDHDKKHAGFEDLTLREPVEFHHCLSETKKKGWNHDKAVEFHHFLSKKTCCGIMTKHVDFEELALKATC